MTVKFSANHDSGVLQHFLWFRSYSRKPIEWKLLCRSLEDRHLPVSQRDGTGPLPQIRVTLLRTDSSSWLFHKCVTQTVASSADDVVSQQTCDRKFPCHQFHGTRPHWAGNQESLISSWGREDSQEKAGRGPDLLNQLQGSAVGGRGQVSVSNKCGCCLRPGSSSASLGWVRCWPGSQSCTWGSACRPAAPPPSCLNPSAHVWWSGTWSGGLWVSDTRQKEIQRKLQLFHTIFHTCSSNLCEPATWLEPTDPHTQLCHLRTDNSLTHSVIQFGSKIVKEVRFFYNISVMSGSLANINTWTIHYTVWS